MYDYDVVIIGGGLVGGSLACALSGSGLRVAVVEAVAAQAAEQPSYDERVIALSLGSRRIFESIGLWPDIAPEAEPIRRIHVSERGSCAMARLDQAEEGVDALGYVVPARALGIAIRAALRYAPDVESFCPARLTCYRNARDGVDLEIQGEGETRRLRTRLLVAADGGDSMVRSRLAPETLKRDYGHDAIITTVTPDRPRPGVAYERFTDTGPLAMLPMTAGRYSVVWTVRRDETTSLLTLSDDDFRDRLQQRFGYRLGRLGRVAPRRVYPLCFMLARRTVGERLLLIGNAAHTLHPVAGQGFNLGLRDVAALAGVLTGDTQTPADPGSAANLARYQSLREHDQRLTATITHGLARIFTWPLPGARACRAAGLLGLDLVPAARHLLARRFMGLDGPLPRLVRRPPAEHAHV